MSEPKALGMTRDEWIRYYLSLTEKQQHKLDRLVRRLTAQNEEAKS